MKQPRKLDLNADLSAHAKMALAYLEQVYYLKQDIANLQKRIKEIEDQSVSLSAPSAYTDTKVQASCPEEARYASAIAEKDLMERELSELTDQLKPLEDQAVRIIREHTVGNYRLVLQWHFIYLFPWNTVAGRVDRTERHVYRLRAEALEKIVLPEDAIWLE